MSGGPALEARRIGLGDVLRGVDLTVRPGELVQLAGESGSGKSLLLAICAGGLLAEEGAVLIDGAPLEERAAAGRGPAFVPQEGGLVPLLTAAESVALPLQARRRPASESEARALFLLDELGLDACANRMVSELSGGQRRRVSFARALAADSPVLLLDEPSEGLDAANVARVLALVEGELERGAAVVVVSDDPLFAGRADSVVEL